MIDHFVVTLDGLEGRLVDKGDGILREVEVAIVETGSIESLILSAGEFATVSPIREYYFKFIIIIIIIYYYYIVPVQASAEQGSDP